MGQALDNGRGILAMLAAFVLLLALVIAPLFSSLTHGPGKAAMEADHAAWHAEQGEHWQATDHGHHDSADHDHSPTVILLAGGDLEPHAPKALWTISSRQASGISHDGPRRPPRLA
jgi:hypothetical protein